MAKQTLPTRALLACGVVAGPMYVTVTMAQALTRDGFDLRRHRFSWLTAGDLGWIHQSNMVLVGVLTVLLSVGVRQMKRTGRGAVWGPRLLGLFGVDYILGGVLTADPVAGFPPGTTPEMVHTTWQGAVQNASRGASSLLLITASLVFAGWFAAQGRRVAGSAWTPTEDLEHINIKVLLGHPPRILNVSPSTAIRRADGGCLSQRLDPQRVGGGV